MTKQCSMCKTVKPVSDFHARKNRKSGLQSKCKPCIKVYRGNWSRADYDSSWITKKLIEDPLYYRKANLKKAYGISLEDYEETLAKQGGVCKVCLGPALGKGAYHVDHDHKTGKIRGLLCHKCNVALGMVQDSKGHLVALIEYLKQSELT